MTAMQFLDTNILLYLIFPTEKDRVKSHKATEILQSRGCVLSVQVLQEFYVQSTRTSRIDPLTHTEAIAFLRTLHRFRIQENTLEVFQKALEIRDKYQISFWDSSIVAAAKISACDQLLSEDLNPGQTYEGVQVINPFHG
jgi:predicted nucleic acid-binding protein